MRNHISLSLIFDMNFPAPLSLIFGVGTPPAYLATRVCGSFQEAAFDARRGLTAYYSLSTDVAKSPGPWSSGPTRAGDHIADFITSISWRARALNLGPAPVCADFGTSLSCRMEFHSSCFVKLCTEPILSTTNLLCIGGLCHGGPRDRGGGGDVRVSSLEK